MSGTVISLVLAHAAVEIALGQGVHELSKEKLPGVHRQGLSTGFYGKVYEFSRGKAEVDTDAN